MRNSDVSAPTAGSHPRGSAGITGQNQTGTATITWEFIFWLAHQQGFRSHIGYADADYFALSGKEVTVARARREKCVPTLEQVERVLRIMPSGTALERRDRALIALTAITGARIGALA